MDSDAPLPRRVYRLKHTRAACGRWSPTRYRLDVTTHRDVRGGRTLALNEIGRSTLRATAPMFADDYRRNRVTGSFVLIDEATNRTAAAGHAPHAGVTGAPDPIGHRPERSGTTSTVDRDAGWARRRARGDRRGSPGCPGPASRRSPTPSPPGCSPLGRPAYVLDGDNVRHGLNADLGFPPPDRARTCGASARSPGSDGRRAHRHRPVVISPTCRRRPGTGGQGAVALRRGLRRHPAAIFERDPKGLYAKASRRADRHDRDRECTSPPTDLTLSAPTCDTPSPMWRSLKLAAWPGPGARFNVRAPTCRS